MEEPKRLEETHQLNSPSGIYRWELWSDGWKMYRWGKQTEVTLLRSGLTDEEMMSTIKLLRS